MYKREFMKALSTTASIQVISSTEFAQLALNHEVEDPLFDVDNVIKTNRLFTSAIADNLVKTPQQVQVHKNAIVRRLKINQEATKWINAVIKEPNPDVNSIKGGVHQLRNRLNYLKEQAEPIDVQFLNDSLKSLERTKVESLVAGVRDYAKLVGGFMHDTGNDLDGTKFEELMATGGPTMSTVGMTASTILKSYGFLIGQIDPSDNRDLLQKVEMLKVMSDREMTQLYIEGSKAGIDLDKELGKHIPAIVDQKTEPTSPVLKRREAALKDFKKKVLEKVGVDTRNKVKVRNAVAEVVREKMQKDTSMTQKEIEGNLKVLVEDFKQRKEKEKGAIDAVRDKRKLEYKQREWDAGINIGYHILNNTGMQEEGKFINTAYSTYKQVKNLHKAFEAGHDGGIGPMGLTSGYIGIAMMVSNAFAKPKKSVEQQMLEAIMGMLQHIQNSIADLKEYNRERFDEVVIGQNTILDKIHATYKKIINLSKENHQIVLGELASIKKMLGDVEKVINRRDVENFNEQQNSHRLMLFSSLDGSLPGHVAKIALVPLYNSVSVNDNKTRFSGDQYNGYVGNHWNSENIIKAISVSNYENIFDVSGVIKPTLKYLGLSNDNVSIPNMKYWCETVNDIARLQPYYKDQHVKIQEKLPLSVINSNGRKYLNDIKLFCSNEARKKMKSKWESLGSYIIKSISSAVDTHCIYKDLAFSEPTISYENHKKKVEEDKVAFKDYKEDVRWKNQYLSLDINIVEGLSREIRFTDTFLDQADVTRMYNAAGSLKKKNVWIDIPPTIAKLPENRGRISKSYVAGHRKSQISHLFKNLNHRSWSVERAIELNEDIWEHALSLGIIVKQSEKDYTRKYEEVNLYRFSNAFGRIGKNKCHIIYEKGKQITYKFADASGSFKVFKTALQIPFIKKRHFRDNRLTNYFHYFDPLNYKNKYGTNQTAGNALGMLMVIKKKIHERYSTIRDDISNDYERILTGRKKVNGDFGLPENVANTIGVPLREATLEFEALGNLLFIQEAYYNILCGANPHVATIQSKSRSCYAYTLQHMSKLPVRSDTPLTNINSSKQSSVEQLLSDVTQELQATLAPKGYSSIESILDHIACCQ